MPNDALDVYRRWWWERRKSVTNGHQYFSNYDTFKNIEHIYPLVYLLTLKDFYYALSRKEMIKQHILYSAGFFSEMQIYNYACSLKKKSIH